MEQNTHETTGPKHPLEHPLDDDRFDNDSIAPRHDTDLGTAEYQARLERSWKHAAWRTEMALRTRKNGRGPSRPEGSF